MKAVAAARLAQKIERLRVDEEVHFAESIRDLDGLVGLMIAMLRSCCASCRTSPASSSRRHPKKRTFRT